MPRRPTQRAQPTQGAIVFDQEVYTLAEAARKVGFTESGLRVAVKRGELAAFVPAGKDPGHTGPGQGYRIRRDELQRWYFGEAGR